MEVINIGAAKLCAASPIARHLRKSIYPFRMRLPSRTPREG
jgi:hypothetical protein